MFFAATSVCVWLWRVVDTYSANNNYLWEENSNQNDSEARQFQLTAAGAFVVERQNRFAKCPRREKWQCSGQDQKLLRRRLQARHLPIRQLNSSTNHRNCQICSNCLHCFEKYRKKKLKTSAAIQMSYMILLVVGIEEKFHTQQPCWICAALVLVGRTCAVVSLRHMSSASLYIYCTIENFLSEIGRRASTSRLVLNSGNRTQIVAIWTLFLKTSYSKFIFLF